MQPNILQKLKTTKITQDTKQSLHCKHKKKITEPITNNCHPKIKHSTNSRYQGPRFNHQLKLQQNRMQELKMMATFAAGKSKETASLAEFQ